MHDVKESNACLRLTHPEIFVKQGHPCTLCITIIIHVLIGLICKCSLENSKYRNATIFCVRNLCDFAILGLIQVLCDLIFAIAAAAFPFSANLG